MNMAPDVRSFTTFRLISKCSCVSIIRSLDHSSPRRLLAALLLILILFRLTTAQDAFVAIPLGLRLRTYHIDFARNSFASPEGEKADRANLYATSKNWKISKEDSAPQLII